ncbi:MAG TPA: hypothetical protein VNW95_03160 [Mucilaginibacter sp.]|jgi:hypothetical protein|nr:hypothetical protein [Mucilaginibacter sp.]
MNPIIINATFVFVGIALKTLLDFFTASRTSKQELRIALTEKRYKVIILLCYAMVYYDKEASLLVINRPDLPSKKRLLNELQAEFINMSLFASDKVIVSMKIFLEKLDISSLNQLAISMRRDLYGIRTHLHSYHFNMSEIDLN